MTPDRSPCQYTDTSRAEQQHHIVGEVLGWYQGHWAWLPDDFVHPMPPPVYGHGDSVPITIVGVPSPHDPITDSFGP